MKIRVKDAEYPPEFLTSLGYSVIYSVRVGVWSVVRSLEGSDGNNLVMEITMMIKGRRNPQSYVCRDRFRTSSM
jgi:hypothetical protein